MYVRRGSDVPAMADQWARFGGCDVANEVVDDYLHEFVREVIGWFP